MKYTKQQRNKIYRKAYEGSCIDVTATSMSCMRNAGQMWYGEFPAERIMNLFPELKLFSERDDIMFLPDVTNRVRSTMFAFMIAMTDSK